MSDAPTIPYWHLYTDHDGVSRQRPCAMSEFHLKAIQQGADPQWLGKPHHEGMTVLFTILPENWIGDWHENPKPQWIVPLSGRWFVEAMDGTRREFGPGDISYGEDQGCATVDGRTGHLSGTVGAATCVMMLIQFDLTHEVVHSCRFT